MAGLRIDGSTEGGHDDSPPASYLPFPALQAFPALPAFPA